MATKLELVWWSATALAWGRGSTGSAVPVITSVGTRTCFHHLRVSTPQSVGITRRMSAESGPAVTRSAGPPRRRSTCPTPSSSSHSRPEVSLCACEFGIEELGGLELGAPHRVEGAERAERIGEALAEAEAAALDDEPGQALGMTSTVDFGEPTAAGDAPEDPRAEPDTLPCGIEIFDHALERHGLRGSRDTPADPA